MATARACELPVLIVNGDDSPRSRIGRGLESVGSMTADTLQRISTTVGGVVKSPVVLLAKVGGLASPRAIALTTPLESSLAERLCHLENQMKSLEEKFNLTTKVDQSTHLHKEKPQFAKSPLQETEKTEIDKTIEKRVQMLEDRVNERMERFERALSSIQSRLDHVEFTWGENVAQVKLQESLLDEPEYYDAEQQSDNFEAQEATKQNSFGGSPILEKSRMKETLTTPSTIVEHIKSLEEIDADNDDFLDPQIVSTPVYSKEAFLTQPMKSVTPSSEPTESIQRNGDGNFLASSDQQLASSLEELHESFVTQSSTTSTSTKFLEIARAVTVDKSSLAHASSKPQSTFILQEPREAFLEEPLDVVSCAKSKEDVEEDATDKSGIIVGVAELPSPPTIEATQEDFSKEPVVVEPNIKLVQDLATQGVVIAFASSEPCAKYKLAEEVLVGLSSAKFEESIQRDNSDNTATVATVAIVGESPKAFAFQDLQEDFAKESLARAPSVELTHETSSQEDLITTSDRALASFELQEASKSMEEPSIVGLSANFEECAQKDKGGKAIVAKQLPLASSQEEPREEFAPSVQSTQVQASQDDIDVEVVALESPKDVTDMIGPTMVATKLSLVSSLEEPKEGFEKESIACAPSREHVEAHSDIVSTSAFVEETLATAPSVNFKECEQKVDDNATISASKESPTSSSFDNPKEDFEKESLGSALSAELAQELALQEHNASQLQLPTSHKGPHEDFDKEFLATTPSARPIHEPSCQDDWGATSDKTLTSSKPEVASEFTKETMIGIPSDNFEEPAQEDGVVKSDIAIADPKPPLASPFEEPQEGSGKEALAPTSSGELAQEDGVVKSDIAIVDPKLPLASPFEESQEGFGKEALAPTSSGELAQEDGVVKSDIAIADAKPPLASPFEEPQEGFGKEALAPTSSGELAQEDGVVKSDIAIADAKPPLAFPFEEPQEGFGKEALAPTSSGELAQEDGVVKSDIAIADAKPPLASPFEEPQEGFGKEALAPTSSGELAQEDGVIKSDIAIADAKPPLASPFEEPREGFGKEALAPTSSGELAQEDGVVKSDIAIADAKPPLASPFEEPQEGFGKEALAPTSSGELAEGLALEEDSHMILTSSKSQGSSKSFEDNHLAKEVEYKLAEDFEVHHEHMKNIESKVRESQSDLAHGGFNENLGTKDSDDHLESDQSSEEFFDAERGSGIFEPWESGELKSFEENGDGQNEHGEALGINSVSKKETLVHASSVELAQESEQVSKRELEEDYESNEQGYAQALGEDLEQPSIQEPKEELGHKFEQQPSQEQELEDLTRNSAMALPPLEPQVTSKCVESREVLAKEPLVAIPSTKFKEPTQANAIVDSGIHDLTLTSTTEEPKIDIVVSPKKSPSSASFHQSSNLELLENLEQKSLDTPITSSTPHETFEREPKSSIAPTIEIAQGHDTGKSNDLYISLEPQLEESQEPLANEVVKATPSSKSTDIVQEIGDGESGATFASLEPQLTPTLEESDEGFIKESLANATPTSKPVNLEESLVDKPLAITGSKLVEESIADNSSTRLVEELPLTPIAEEPQDGSVSSLVEGKLGQDRAHEKFLEDIKIIPKPIKEAIPRTQSDLTHVKFTPSEATKDSTTMLQSQGSFLAFGATLVDSKEALMKEPLSSAKLSELLKEDSSSGKRKGLELGNSSITSTIEESQKPLVAKHEPLLATAKSLTKGHARRWRGFYRSSSEPQFAYKLEEHRKALANESLVVADGGALPSASKLGEDHAQEDLGDMQCLPFRILGEGKHPQKESEFKLVEDANSLAMKSETTSSSPYVLEPKPSKIKEKKKKEKKPDRAPEEKAMKEKKKKEKKEKKLDVAAKEKERRLSLDVGEMERKSSLREKEKGSKYSLRVEEKQKQPFRHLRDRLRHAFSVNKEP